MNRDDVTHLFAVRTEVSGDERVDLVAEHGNLGLPKVSPLIDESSFARILPEQSRLRRKGAHWCTSLVNGVQG